MAGVRSNVDSIQDVSHVMEIVAKTIKEVVQYANLDKGRKILKQNRNMIAIIFCITPLTNGQKKRKYFSVQF